MRIYCFTALLFLSLPGVAASSNVPIVGKILMLTNYEQHQGTILALDDMSASEGSCVRNDFLILPLEHKYFDQNYSLLLAAKMADKEVRVLFDFGDCVDSLPRVKHLSLL